MRYISLVLAMAMGTCITSADESVAFSNTGFEIDSESDDRPDGWSLKIAEPGSVTIDAAVKHSGGNSLRIRQSSATSYSYAMQLLDNSWPGQRMIASVWIKAQDVAARGIGVRLYCGYEGGWGHAARGPVLDETGSCGWQKVVVPFNTRDKRQVGIHLYLHEATGTVWFDDLQVTLAPFEAAAATFSNLPASDGLPGQEAWATVMPQGMVWSDDNSPAPERTVKLAHDSKHIYAMVQAPSPALDPTSDKPPAVQLALSPDASGDRACVFSVSPDGRRSTSAVNDTRPAGEWHGAVRDVAGTLTTEFAIPLSLLQPSLQSSHHWKVNVIDARPDGRDAELIFTGNSSLSPPHFADVQLPALDLTPYRLAQLKARLTRMIADYDSLSDELRLDTVPDKLEGKKDARDGMDRFGAEIEQLSRRAGALGEASDNEWRDVGRLLDAATQSLVDLRAATRPVAAYAMARKQVAKPTWSVATQTPMRKVMQDAKLFDGSFTGSIELSAARGEGESIQLVVMPLTRDLTNVRAVLATRLAGPPGAVIRKPALELNTVGYVSAQKPDYERPADAEQWPDVLLPYSPINVKKGEVRPFWLTVWVPRDAKVGVYKGKIVLTARGTHRIVLDMKLRVYDFELPRRATLRTSFGLSASNIAQYYFGDDDVRKHIDGPTYQRWCGELLRHRISPYLACEFAPEKDEDGQYQFQPWEDNIDYCVQQGLTSMLVRIMSSKLEDSGDYGEEYKRAFRDDTGAAYGRLKERGWLDLAFICAYDEPRPSAYPAVLAGHSLIRETCPDIDILQTTYADREPTELVGEVGIWCPLTSVWNPDFYHERKTSGEEIWWYVCCSPHPPHANFFIDQDAIDHRILMWQTWQQGVQGLLYWQTTWWTGNSKPDGSKGQVDPAKWVSPSHSVFKVNGDGHLLYPGNDLAPLSSLRLAVIRDGMEDYDYFTILSRAIQASELPATMLDSARALLEVGPDISRSLTRFTKNPQKLQEHRNAMAEMIERLLTHE